MRPDPAPRGSKNLGHPSRVKDKGLIKSFCKVSKNLHKVLNCYIFQSSYMQILMRISIPHEVLRKNLMRNWKPHEEIRQRTKTSWGFFSKSHEEIEQRSKNSWGFENLMRFLNLVIFPHEVFGLKHFSTWGFWT